MYRPMTSTYPLYVPLYDTIRDAILTKADMSPLNLPHCDVAALCSHSTTTERVGLYTVGKVK